MALSKKNSGRSSLIANQTFGIFPASSLVSAGSATHKKAMPVILTEPDEIETWLTAPWEEAKALQPTLADHRLIVLSA